MRSLQRSFSLFTDSRAALRFIGIAALVIGALLLRSLVPKPSDISSTRWYSAVADRPLFADSAYRLGVYLQDVNDALGLTEEGAIHDLQEGAVAAYERQALRGQSPSPIACQRLGVIYAQRGYRDQACEMFGRAAQLDEAHAGMYLAAAALYGDAPLSPARLQSVEQSLRLYEPWLRDMLLADYYAHRGDEAKATETTAAWRAAQGRFARGLLAVLAGYLLLGLCGIAVILFGLLKYLTRTQAPMPPRPAPRLPWVPLDVAEVVAALFALAVGLGSVLNILQATKLLAQASPLTEALVAVALYALLVFVAIAWIAQKAAAVGMMCRAWLVEMGLHRDQLWPRVMAGVRGYGVLIALYLLGWMLLGGPGLAAAGSGFTGDILQGLRDPATAVIHFLLLCIAAPVAEEIIFRGFAYSALRRRFTASGASVISAGLFAAMHPDAPAGGQLIVFAVGILFAVLYERERSILPCIVAHALHNTLLLALIALQAC